MKGIILAGGSGTRLAPLTHSFSKHLLPVFDKPLIYYPLSTLMLAGVRKVLLITTPADSELFRKLLGNGSQFGIEITYAEQEKPLGIADSLRIAADFVDMDKLLLILGDNIFHGAGLPEALRSMAVTEGAEIFAHKVRDPARYGIVELDATGNVVSLEEKPLVPKSPYAIPGLYCLDRYACQFASEIVPSQRGELEIVDVLIKYAKTGKLRARLLPRGSAWLDTGTFESLHDATSFVKALQDRQGQMISCPEEIAWNSGWITDNELLQASQATISSEYGMYLKQLIQGG